MAERHWADVIASVETSAGCWQLRLLRNGESRGFLSTTGPCNLEAAETFTSKAAADEASRTRVRTKEGRGGRPEYYLDRRMSPLHMQQIRATLEATPPAKPYVLLRHPGRGDRWRVITCKATESVAQSTYQQQASKMRQGCVVLWSLETDQPLKWQSAHTLRTQW